MSHFTVLVIGSNPEEQLEPFQENNMDDCPEEYLEFEVEIESGKEEEYRIKALRGDYWDDKRDKRDNYRNMPIDEFIKEYSGYEQNDNGDWGYMCNPNAKWDWYQIGGRWAGQLMVKENVELPTPNFSHGWSEEEKLKVLTERKVDQAIKKDIDFEAMKSEAVSNARKSYRKVLNLFSGKIPKIERLWKDVLEDNTIGDIEKKRELYHSQEALKQVKEVEKEHREELGFFFDLEEFQCTEIEYLDRASRNYFSTFAVLKDGKWYEKGEMLMFGIAKDEKDEDTWQEEFNALIESLDEDTLLTVVDCHI